MAQLGGEGLWCGASLRPWQILHSRLARMHTCGLLERDVWELVDETVEAASPDHLMFRDEICKKEEWQLMMLVGDDEELWRHGGLMEARIRDWINSKMEEDRQLEVAPFFTPATFSSEFSESAVQDHHEMAGRVANFGSYSLIGDEVEDTEAAADDGDDHYCYYNYGAGIYNTVARYSSDQFSGALDSRLELESLDQAAIYGRAVDYGDGQQFDTDVFYEHAAHENEEDNQTYIGANNTAILAAPLEYTSALEPTRYTCLQVSDDMQAGISTDHQVDEQQEDDQEVCAVCLEKLHDMDDHDEDQVQALTVSSITRLPCRHSFHSHCLSPWLSASSRCPCCRAPITLSFSPHVEAPPNMGIGPSGNCSDIVQRDMMGLLAEMEAALDRFGLLS